MREKSKMGMVYLVLQEVETGELTRDEGWIWCCRFLSTQRGLDQEGGGGPMIR